MPDALLSVSPHHPQSLMVGTDSMHRELGYVAISRARLRHDIYIVAPAQRVDAYPLEDFAIRKRSGSG
jgi:hypothetical protein